METETNDKEAIKYITSMLPLLTLIVLIFGIAKQFVYFYYFNFNVFPFLEISELLPQTTFDFITSFFYVAFTIFITGYFNVYLRKDRNEIKNIEIVDEDIEKLPKAERVKELDKKLHKLRRTIYLILFIVLLGVYDSINYILNNNVKQNFLGEVQIRYHNFAIYYGFAFTIIFIVDKCNRYFKLDKTILNSLILPVFLTLMLNGFLNGYFNYNYVYKFHTHTNYSITINSKKIISNNEYYMIGKSKSSVFFFDTKSNLVTVYPVSNISEMTIGSD